MAYLIDPQHKFKVYLRPYHTFGRKNSAGWSRVDTAIVDQTVSRQHAFIEFVQGTWMLKDTSLNGILVNQKPLPPKQAYPLKLHDQITFGDPNLGSFTVADLSPYQPFLLPRSMMSERHIESRPITPYSTACAIDESALFLNHYQLLPSEQEPELCIYQASDTGRWTLEHLQTGTEQRLSDGGMLHFQGQQWQAFIAVYSDEETVPAFSASPTESPEFQFKMTQDEETIALNIRHKGEFIELGTRVHHYPLVLLARKRLEDLKNGQSNESSGWVFRSQLAKMLGVDTNHLNILLHRIRKQLSHSTDQAMALAALEFKDRQVRFGHMPVTIQKGEKLEAQYAP